MLALILSATMLAQPDAPIDPEISYELSEDFARCSALYEHLANIVETSGAAANAEELRGTGRGAQLAAMFLAASAGIDEARIDEFIANFYELELTRQMAFIERGELDEAQMTACAELQPIQVEIVTMLRREAYRPE